MSDKNDLGTEEVGRVLRAQAEQRLRTMAPGGGNNDPQKLLHELQVHQVELEMQNEALRATHAELEAALTRASNLFDFAPIPYLTTDAQGRIGQANHAAAKLFNQPRSSLCSMGLPGFVHPDDLPVYQGLMRKAEASGIGETGEIELSISGRRVWVILNVVMETDKTHSLIALEDITEHKEAEQQVAMAANRYNDMLRANKDGFWLVDGKTGNIIDANDAALTMLGYSREELLSRRILDIDVQFDAEAYARKMQHILAEGWGVFETQHRAKDGRILDVEVSTLPEKSSQSLVAFIRDITKRKQAEADLLAAKEAADSASAAKSQFLAHMSHELRTPLNAVLGFAQILEREGLPPDQQEMVGMIRESGATLLRTINDILDLSKLEAGQVSLDMQPFSLSALLERMGQLYRPSAEAKGLRLRCENRVEHLDILHGDSHRLEQVLANLIGNAIKFTAKGEVVLAVLPLSVTETAVRLRFQVEDTGIGMDEATLARLFQPFSQGDSSITRRFGGTGLGLSISKRLVEQMGGEMGVSSQSGQGSIFWFEVPFRLATGAPPEGDQAAGAIPPQMPRLGGLRVLAVDDSLINLRMIERALTLQGAVVTLAKDGQDALDRLRNQPHGFDVVLMDIQMPVMDGISATREIRRDPELAQLPVIALTAGVLPEEREAALGAGMNDFLGKPLSLEQMQSVLSRYV